MKEVHDDCTQAQRAQAYLKTGGAWQNFSRTEMEHFALHCLGRALRRARQTKLAAGHEGRDRNGLLWDALDTGPTTETDVWR